MSPDPPPSRHRPHLHSHLTSMALITSQASYQAVHLPDPIDERARDAHTSKCVKLRNKKTVKLGKKGEARVRVQMSRPRDSMQDRQRTAFSPTRLLTDAGLSNKRRLFPSQVQSVSSGLNPAPILALFQPETSGADSRKSHRPDSLSVCEVSFRLSPVLPLLPNLGLNRDVYEQTAF